MNRDLFLSMDVDRRGQAIRQALEARENYFGTGERGWTVTEMLIGIDQVTIAVLNALCGTMVTGEKKGAGSRPPIRTIKLKVLTRQACSCDAQGNIINGTLTGCDRFAKDAPSIDTPPIPGDIIVVKGDLRTKEDIGEDPTPRALANFEQRHQHEKFRFRSALRNNYDEYEVDADGCITVEPAHAIQLLRRNGEELVFPKFKREALGDTRPQRVISNWFFREVPPNYSEPKQKQPEQEEQLQAEEEPIKRSRGRKPKAAVEIVERDVTDDAETETGDQE